MKGQVDTFCEKYHIRYIDFRKIDIEGHELEVLVIAGDMMSNNKIYLVQFEFNEINQRMKYLGSKTF